MPARDTLRRSEAADARSIVPGDLRRAEARLQRELGVGDLNTAIQARRWEAEQDAALATFDGDSPPTDHE